MRESVYVNDSFIIDEDDIEQAEKVCYNIEEPELRKRALANVLLAHLAQKFFDSSSVDVESGIHNVSSILEKYEISDIYYNGAYIDVRFCFDDSNLCIPCEQKDFDLLPQAYMFIKIDKQLTEAEVLGFVYAEDIDFSNCQNGYYWLKSEDLKSFYDIEKYLHNSNVDFENDLESEIIDYNDSEIDLKSFLARLLNDHEARLMLQEAESAKQILKNISYDELIVDGKEPEQEQDSSGALDDLLQEQTESLETANTEITEHLDTLFDETSEIQTLDYDDTFSDIEPIENETSLEENEQIDNSLTIDGDNLLEEPEAGSIEDFTTQTTPSLNSITEEFSKEDSVEPLEINASDEHDANLLSVADDTDLEFEHVEDSGLKPTNEEANFVNEVMYDNSSDTLKSSEDEESSNNSIIDNETTMEENSSALVEDNNLEPEEDSFALGEGEYKEPENEMIEPAFDEIVEQSHTEQENPKNDSLDNLFGENNEVVDDEYNISSDTNRTSSSKRNKILLMTAIVALLGVGGYFGFQKFSNNTLPESPNKDKDLQVAQKVDNNVAMPKETVETVDNVDSLQDTDLESVNAIEKDIDATVLVSNLSINWEVPAGYLTNNSAKRYFTKLGKILQLNLKSELLLISKAPITNKITVELEFNNAESKFNVKGIQLGSGVKAIDDAVLSTVNDVLNMKQSTNMNIFKNIPGNPILVIHL